LDDRVGVVGVGNMGFGISSNLLKAGFKVFVYDIRPEPLEAIQKKGAVVASCVKELAQKCPLVFSVLLNYEQNLSVFSGPEGLVENMTEGGCVFVCSTISPKQARTLAEMAEEHGIRFLDAPISGGVEGARAGTLSVMVGGNPSTLEEHRGALEVMGSNIYHFGDVGAGESAKAIVQLLVVVNNVGVAEALLLAAKSGLNLEKVHNLISNSAGDSWIFQHRATRMMKRDFSPRGVLKILLKDVDIVRDAAKSLDLVLPITTLAGQLYRAGVNAGWGDEDDSAILKVLEKLTNYSIG
jgi:3-hydroxyisobutyrate dehydrogenase-like beta-hydroxyacid dehydrogenase